MKTPQPADAQAAALQALAARLGPSHLRHRLALEAADEALVLRKGPLLQFLEHWLARPALLHALLKLAGLRERARRNTLCIELRERDVVLERLPPALDGLRLLHLSDLHLDVGGGFMAALIERVRGVAHDLCVITGDFRFRTRGPWQPAMEALASLRPHLAPDTFAVLGNHDSIRMLPSIEALGVRLLMNESACFERGGQALWLAGIDDAHYFRAQRLRASGELCIFDVCFDDALLQYEEALGASAQVDGLNVLPSARPPHSLRPESSTAVSSTQ